MAEPNHILDPTLVARLSGEVRALLERRVPFGEDYKSNLGILIGLRFAQLLVDTAASSAPGQIQEILAEAVKLTAARLDRQIARQQPDTDAKFKDAHFNHALIAECEIHDPQDPKDFPLDDFIRELEERHDLPPEAGAT